MMADRRVLDYPLAEEGRAPFGPHPDQPDRRADRLRDPLQVPARGVRQLCLFTDGTAELVHFDADMNITGVEWR